MNDKILGQIGVVPGADALRFVQDDRQVLAGGLGNVDIETNLWVQDVRSGMDLAAGPDLVDGQF
jgi:hypothetical protein